MRKTFYILSLLAITSLTSCDSGASEDTENEEPDGIELAIKESNDNLEILETYLQQYRNSGSQEDLDKALEQLDKCSFEVDEDSLAQEEKKLCLQQKLKAEQKVESVRKNLSSISSHVWVTMTKRADYLMNKGAEMFPLYVQRGDRLKVSVTSSDRFSVYIYNAESHRTLRTLVKKTTVHDSIEIKNSAIYLVEIVPTAHQYIDLNIMAQSSDLSHLKNEQKIEAKEVEAQKRDFKARHLDGVQMKNLFEEPRKFTLRGKLKAAFSGNSRALVALQVPPGAKDVLYSMRISTNETAKQQDGQFYDSMCRSYRKIKFLGLPLYESQSGSGLLATILGDNIPPREEDAYINMYVFMDAGQARKFQDGELTSKLKYHVDYSTMGTQSCNGRIPCGGKRTIYLGFDNERMRYNNYVWLEAIAAVPHVEYYRMQYTLK